MPGVALRARASGWACGLVTQRADPPPLV